MTKNIKFVITTFVFFKLKMHQNPFSAGARQITNHGALPRTPDPLVGWGGGYPLPWGWGYPLPIFLPARLRRLELGARFSGPLNTKILATPVDASYTNVDCNIPIRSGINMFPSVSRSFGLFQRLCRPSNVDQMDFLTQ